MANTTSIPALPLRTPVVDAGGYMTRPWLLALQGLPGAAGVPPTDGGPGTPGTAPPQLVAGDWNLSLIEYGFGDPAGQHGDAVPVAHIRAAITPNPAGVSYFSAFVYYGSSAPADPALYRDIGVNQPKPASGPTTIDFWIARPPATTSLYVVVGASSPTWQAFPTTTTLAPHSVTVTAVSLPSQPSAFVASVYYENRGGLPCGALAFSWTPPSDLEYFSANVYKTDCDSTFTPLPGEVWDLVGNAIDGFDQRVLNQWWPTAGIGYTKFKVQSVSRVLDADGHNLENTVGAPTSNLTIDASSGISPSAPPSQLASSDWSIALIEYGFGDPTGQHGDAVPVAHLRITITANPPDVTYFSPFAYWGASPPTDVSLYQNLGVNLPKVSSGSTIIDFWIARPAATTTLQVVVASSSESFQTFPKSFALPSHSVSVNATGLPSQPTAFTASVYYQNRGGVDCGALAFTWTPPADLEYFAASVYKIDCDATYTPLPGKTWDLVGNAVSGFDQRVLNQWWPTSGVGYVKFKLQSVSRVLDATGHNIENTVGGPTANLTINASGGLDLSAANALSVGAGLSIAFTTLTAKVSSGIQFDASGNIVVKNGDGIAIDTSGKVTVNAGVGLQLSGGLITTKPSTGLTADGSGIYIPGGAITNALLAALAVAETNLQAGAVTQTKIANAAVGTAQIGTAQITTALIANAAITNALLGNAVVGTANIQNAAITDALIANLAVSKLLAGTAVFTGDVRFARSGGSTHVDINSAGVSILDPTGSNAVSVVPSGIVILTGSDSLSITSNGGSYLTGASGAISLKSPGGVIVTQGDFMCSPGSVSANSSFKIVTYGVVIDLAGQFVGSAVSTSGSVNAGSFKISGTTVIDSSRLSNCTAYQISGNTVIDSNRYASFIQVTVNGTLGINSACQFVGNGVDVRAAGNIGGAGFATWVPATPGYAFGGTNATPINIGGTNYYLRGGILCTS